MLMDNIYIYLIMALFPVSALMLMVQNNPYQALVIRGILGAIAVLSYIILGAADVALTEALVGTMLGIALYIIAVRSSFVMRLGLMNNSENKSTKNDDFIQLKKEIQKTIDKVYLRLELVMYDDENSLNTALNNKEIHGLLLTSNNDNNYEIKFRVKRLFDLFKSENYPDNLKVQYSETTSKS